jgi:predicted CoA-binding protein
MSDNKSRKEIQEPSEIIARGLWHAVNEPRQGYFVLADSLIAALAETGYRIVPVGPTEAMIQAGIGETCDNDRIFNIWRAMIEAAGR